MVGQIATMTAVPVLPDTERRTEATLSSSTGPVDVGFDIYGNGTDYAAWVEVWLDGVKLTAVTDWTLDSPSGSLSTLARPITDARITFTSAVTGDVDIVGADRPRRTSQLTEGQPVTARMFNQAVTQLVARLREAWDVLRGRTLIGRPGETVDLTLPAIADRAGGYFTWNSDGEPDVAQAPVLGGGTLSNNAVTNAFLRDSGACSVIGRAANSSGDPADISASANNRILARMTNTLAFSTLTSILDTILGSTRGMILRRESASWAAYALGAAGTFLKSDGTDAVWAAPTAGLPRGYIDGCILANNASDATNDIDFGGGVCRDSTNAADINCSAMTKQLDADWAAGTGAGMRYSGAAIASTTYHLYAIVKADGTQDWFAYAGTDPTAVLPSGYIYWRLVGSIIRSGGAILAFVQHQDTFLLTTPIADVNITTPPASKTTATLTVPTGLRLMSLLSLTIFDNGVGGGVNIIVYQTDTTDAAPTSNGSPGASVSMAGSNARGAAQAQVLVNTSGQLCYRSDSALGYRFQIITRGWIHPRGRNA